MAHSFNEHRQHHVEKSRAKHMTRGYATGGSVDHDDETLDHEAKMEKKERKRGGKVKAMKAEGGPVKHRADRPGRKRGGRMNKKGGTTVNVITGHPQTAGLGGPMMPPPVGASAAPPMMPPRPMMPPPGAMPPGGPGMPPGGPMAGPGMPPPGMPPRANGGRATYKKGGRVNDGSPVFNESMKAGTQISHSPGKNDGKDLGRGKPITYKRGGAIKRATGGPVEAPAGKKGMVDMEYGAGGGNGRMEKARKAKNGMAP